jgi:hypothetical protein
MNDLYYRPTVRNSRKSFRSKSKYLKLLYPVGGLVAVIFVIWLLMQVWGFFAGLKGTDYSTSATIYVAEGSSMQRQNFGTTQYLPSVSGDLILEGDSVRTLQNTKAVVEFFNGLVVRLDESTTLTLDKLENGKQEDSIELSVVSGSIWLNKPETIKTSSVLVVNTNYLSVNTVGTVFNVKAGLPESVSVLEGTVLVDIIDSNEGSVIDQVNIESGQQMTLDSTAYESFKKREVPRVLSGLSDSFKDSTWYKWNLREDENPTNFLTDSSLTNNSDYIDQDSEVDQLDDLSDDIEEDLNTPKPKVTFPKSGELITSDTVEITGTVPADTQAVVVTSFETGTANPYVLKGFKAGDLNFKYIAKYSPDGTGNLSVGMNKFEVRSVDSNGEESPATTLQFEVEIDGVEAKEDNADTTNTTDNDVSTEFDASLSAPVLKTVNDTPAESGFNLSENRGVIVGSIGTWAKSVVVNGYKLQQYVPNSGEFSYILSEGFNTLKSGENKVVVYGFDEKGNRGTPATFIINWDGTN